MISNLMRPPAGFPRTGMRSFAAAALLGLLTCGAQAADTQRGAGLYTTHCAVCHGVNGTPVMPGSPNFRRMESLMRPDMQLVTAIRNGKGAMPGYFGILRDREILDVIAYLRTFG
jgi:cytochrome c6